MPKNKKKTRSTSNKQSFQLLKPVFTGSLTGLSVFFALTTIFTLIAYKQDFEQDIYTVLITTASVLSGFISGFVAVMPIKRNGLISGFISVLPMFMIIIIIASVVSRSGIGMWGWINLGAMIIAGASGGIVSANTHRKVKIK